MKNIEKNSLTSRLYDDKHTFSSSNLKDNKYNSNFDKNKNKNKSSCCGT
jgi:hypothetical protein